jgi:hypothetical protein
MSCEIEKYSIMNKFSFYSYNDNTEYNSIYNYRVFGLKVIHYISKTYLPKTKYILYCKNSSNNKLELILGENTIKMKSIDNPNDANDVNDANDANDTNDANYVDDIDYIEYIENTCIQKNIYHSNILKNMTMICSKNIYINIKYIHNINPYQMLKNNLNLFIKTPKHKDKRPVWIYGGTYIKGIDYFRKYIPSFGLDDYDILPTFIACNTIIMSSNPYIKIQHIKNKCIGNNEYIYLDFNIICFPPVLRKR